MDANYLRSAFLVLLVIPLIFNFYGCGKEASPEVCGDYPDQLTSPYNLPWEVGTSFEVYTGNCTHGNPTHSGDRKYAYDIMMPVGTNIVAARGGRVTRVIEHNSDDDHTFGNENHLVIEHEDGTFGFYVHFMQDGIDVNVNDQVNQGDVVGKIGTSGSIGPSLTPHLHFELVSTFEPITSLPVTFANTTAHPNGLVTGHIYTPQ